MCGICGVYRSGGQVDLHSVRRMVQALQHRGPDGEGIFVKGEIGLGHRRLSIIDLGGGSQPMTNEDGSLQIVFNGEIYNFIELRKDLESYGHIFQTRSDTEVILHGYEQWGFDCVNRFNGIFAFALWDGAERRLFLARDHLGVKPLYYTRMGDRLMFASEIKALLTDADCPRQVDLQAMSQLFTLRYVPAPATLFRGISKLPAAHVLIADKNGVTVRRYWNWTPSLATHIEEDVAVEQYQSLVEDAVKLQMRSDVPVGLFLSSGVDSGALLALMSRYTDHPLHTFTIGFEDGEKSNETDHARELAVRFGSDHEEMIVTSRDYEKYYERYLWDLEEPVGNETAAAFYFVSLIASKKVKVALTGQGADEPWAGYHRHIGVTLSKMYSRLPLAVSDYVIRPLAVRLFSNERVVRGVSSLSEPDMLTRFVKIYSFYSSDMKSRLFQPWVAEQVSVSGEEARESLRRLYTDVEKLDPLTQMLYIDTRANLPDDLLMVADKTAMANSLEARVPYLDYRIVEFAETLPPDLKLRFFRGKYLHKRALAKWLPRQVVYRKKKGFANPVDRWLRERMARYVRDLLLSEDSAIRKYFHQDYVRELVRLHESKQGNYMRHIYLLLSFEMWHRKFLDPAHA